MASGSKLIANPRSASGHQQAAEINGIRNWMLFKSKRSKQVRQQDLNIVEQAHNKCQQADLGKLSPFLQKDAKMPPSYPSRCGRRYVAKMIRVRANTYED